MNIREALEKREAEILSPYAALSSKTAGRARKESECDYRTAFQRDRDKIIHSKAFRRLKHKTQVFISPVEDHYRTRLTHTLEVSQIARTIARALFLNEDLAEAIALGHDLGHPPFGHAGEFVLEKILKEYGRRFKHNEQSVRVVEVLEKDGRGLNLTAEVIEGIGHHPRYEPTPSTLEGQIVRLSDRFAYIRHDIEDAVYASVIAKKDLPKKYTKVLGSKILDIIVPDVIINSMGRNEIKMSKEVRTAVDGLYDFMYDKVYTNVIAKAEESKIPYLIRMLFRHYLYAPRELKGYSKGDKGERLLQKVTDFIAGMTDRYATNKFIELFVPSEWRGRHR
jgi:dGTPase